MDPENNNKLSISPTYVNAAMEFNNVVDILKFSRPADYENWNLYLRFEDANQSYQDVALLAANEYPIPESYLTTPVLKVQPYFQNDSGEKDFVPPILLRYGRSIQPSEVVPVNVSENEFGDLQDKAIAGVVQTAMGYDLQNVHGTTIGSIVTANENALYPVEIPYTITVNPDNTISWDTVEKIDTNTFIEMETHYQKNGSFVLNATRITSGTGYSTSEFKRIVPLDVRYTTTTNSNGTNRFFYVFFRDESGGVIRIEFNVLGTNTYVNRAFITTTSYMEH
jgi:hypothetical protein